jgi:FkbM family methyltransferase
VRPALTTAARWYVRYAPGHLGKPPISRQVDLALQATPRRFVTTTRFGASVAGTSTDLLQRYLYEFGVWEPNLTAWISGRLKPGDVFVDVGANIGYFTLLAARLVRPGGHVVAVEASPSIFASLRSNLERNLAENVRSVQVAAADAPQRLPVWRSDPTNLGATTTVYSHGLHWEAEVNALPLTEILTPAEASRARLIKIDVEGFEAAVVRGLIPMLTSCRDDLEVVVEVNGSRTPPGDDAEQLVAQLTACGFHVYAIENDYEPDSYVSGQPSRRPQRVDQRIGGQPADLVFSRLDADHL